MMGLASTMQGIVHLEVGEPSFPTPSHIVEAAVEAARSGRTGYTPTAGVPALRDAIAARASARWNRPVTADRVLVTAGAVGALANAVLATVDDGDEILLPEPGWPNYTSMARLCGATPRYYQLRAEHGFVPDPDDVAGLVTPRTKAMLINTPGNPTGVVFPAEVLDALVALSRRCGFTLISDEIYEDLVFDGEHVSAARHDDDVLYISGVSKSYAMTGWRLGFIIAPRDVVSAMEKLQEPLVSCAAAVSQAAALAALRGPQDCVATMRDVYRARRDYVARRLTHADVLPAVPAGAFYALVDLSDIGLSGMDLARQLLTEARVATAPGATFGSACDRMVRISFAVDDDELAEGCERLLAFRERHRIPGSSRRPDSREVGEAV